MGSNSNGDSDNAYPEARGDAGVEARLISRRSRRLVGREMLSEAAIDTNSVPEGPELVGPVTPIPERGERSHEIREKLLDTAELLFSRWGYTGVSVRDVTDLAGMRLANVNYYFGSKQNLYLEVIRRRAMPVSELRIAALQALDDGERSDQDYIRGYVDAYVDPALTLLESGSEGWRSYFRLIAHVAYSRLWPQTMQAFYNEAAHAFIASLQRRFPQADRATVQNLFLMMVASSMYTLARTGRVETLDEPAFSSDDLYLLGPRTKEFIVNGMAAVLVPQL